MAIKESFVLTISPKYVPDWGKWEAFRELMQNVIDRQHEIASAEIIFTYNPIQQRITIGNKLSYLDRKTLVLGETTKSENDAAIGKYGEGYKLALLVLLRQGTRVRIRTGNEVWAPVIKFSEQFQTELLTINVIASHPSDNLLFDLDGITPEDYRLFQKNCLFINPPIDKIDTPIGKILLDESLKGKVFIEGLYVCDFDEQEKIRYGYDMKASHLSLDRDRKKVNSFNLLWEVAQMYTSLDATRAGMIYSLQKEGWRDIAYLENHRRGKGNPLYEALCTMHYHEFLDKFGKTAIPVKTQAEADFIREKYNNLLPVLVETIKYEYITNSSIYAVSSKASVVKETTPYSITKDALNKILSGKENKEVRDKMIKEFLPLTRGWMKR